jgi:protein-S-isoprenylcysteine O-methyltransferase Ste14
MTFSFAAISRSRTWDFLTRAVGVSFLAMLGTAALSAILATWRQLSLAGPNTSLIATLVVNVCIFVLMLIECTLIVGRPRAIAKAAGIGTRLTALAGSWIIFLVVLIPVRTDMPAPWYVVAATLSTVGDLFAMVIVLHLGGSYSVMAEARRLVERGPYSVVRHPLYLAEQVALMGALMTYLSWRAVALFALQSFFQYLRARNEERILTLTFPAYAAYAQRTPMLVPGWPHGGR